MFKKKKLLLINYDLQIQAIKGTKWTIWFCCFGYYLHTFYIILNLLQNTMDALGTRYVYTRLGILGD